MIRLQLAMPLAGALLCAACAIDHPRAPLTPAPSLLTAGDGRVRLTVDQVIVPGSPAAWSTDTAWDEYVIRLAAADDAVQITNITLVDFADLPVESATDRRTLIRDARPDARWLGTVIWEMTLGSPEKALADHATFWAGPILGALLGGLLYGKVFSPGKK